MQGKRDIYRGMQIRLGLLKSNLKLSSEGEKFRSHFSRLLWWSCFACCWHVELTQKESAEKCVYNRIGHIINAFHELLQTALPVGPSVDAMMRVVYRLYLLLTTLVKWVCKQLLSFLVLFL